MPKKSKSNDDWRIEAQKRAEQMRENEADMYAMSFGFRDADGSGAQSNNGEKPNDQNHPLPILSSCPDRLHDSAGCSEPASRTSRGL